MKPPPRVGLVGVSGYSRVHLQHLLEFHTRQELRLAAVVAVNRPEEAETCRRLEALGCRVFDRFDELQRVLPAGSLDLCVIPSPIHHHAAMSIAALEAGRHVLVEKPVAATVAEAQAIAAAAARSGRTAAVGFQYLHAPEVQALRRRLVAGRIGELRSLKVHAAWPRGRHYYTRNDWVGRLRTPAGAWVLDSPVNNAMAHFFMLMLFLAAPEGGRVARPAALTAELYRAQPIESFDTAVLHLQTESGCRLSFYGTHSSRELGTPRLELTGTRGRGEWVQDCHAWLDTPEGRWHEDARPEAHTRECMLRDVLARVRGEPEAFVCTPEMALEHTRCVNALHAGGVIVEVPSPARTPELRDGDSFTYVAGLDEALRLAFDRESSLAEAGLPWAVRPMDVVLGDDGLFRPA
ncbi:MAG TPA: Gfo/Idh/MocA family oxidoreductase [Opitutaceae bacterium]